MSVSVTFRPLFVGMDTAYCSILELDDYKILLDCGWDDALNVEDLAALKEMAPEIDCILLTHASLYHIGALPYIIDELNPAAQIYATTPVKELGEIILTDLCKANCWVTRDTVVISSQYNATTKANEPVLQYRNVTVTRDPTAQQHTATQSDTTHTPHPYDADLVTKAFQRITDIGFNREIPLVNRGTKLMASCHRAGHTFGGSYWHITKEAEEIVYVASATIAREAHIEGLDRSELSSTTLFILGNKVEQVIVPQSSSKSSSTGSTPTPTPTIPPPPQLKPRQEREALLIETISNTFTKNGTAVIPVSQTIRALELIKIVNTHWEQNKIKYPALFVSPSATKFRDVVSHLAHFASTRDVYDKNNTNPFHFSKISMCSTYAEAAATIKEYYKNQSVEIGPAVIICAMESIANGPAYDYFAASIKASRDTIILTEAPFAIPQSSLRPPQGKFTSQNTPLQCQLLPFLYHYAEKLGFEQAMPKPPAQPKQLLLPRLQLVAMTPDEYELFQVAAQVVEEAHNAQQRLENSLKGDIDGDEAAEFDEWDPEATGGDSDAGSGKDRFQSRRKRSRGLDQLSELYYGQSVEFIRPQRAQWGATESTKHDFYGQHFDISSLKKKAEEVGALVHRTPEEIQRDMELNQKIISNNQLKEQLIPTQMYKVLMTTTPLPFTCKVKYINFTRLLDVDSVFNIISSAVSKQLVLLNGTTTGRHLVAKVCQVKQIPTTVLVPEAKQTLAVSSDTNIRRFVLSEKLIRQLTFEQVEGYSLGRVSAQIRIPPPLTAHHQPLPLLDPPQEDLTSGHASLYVGRLTLPLIKDALEIAGIPSELHAGVLLCGEFGHVQVRKALGRFLIDGSLCEDLFRVREVLYDQFKIV